MILVTGGTGLVGAHLLVQLALKNVAVKAIYRNSQRLACTKKVFSYYSDEPALLFAKITWIQADILDILSLEDAFTDIDKVYHCAALISFDPAKFDVLENINQQGTANIVNLCIDFQVQKLCYVSSIATLGKELHKNIVDEESEWSTHQANPYAITKHLAEMEVWRGAQEGLNTVIVNPGVILGPGFWNAGSGKFFKTAAKEYTYFPPSGTGFIAVNDVVKIMMLLMESSIHTERFILVAENLSYQNVLHKIAVALGKKPPTKMLKPWQLKTLCLFDRLQSFVTNKERSITKSTIQGLQRHDIYANTKIKNAIEFSFEPIDKTIVFCAKHFIAETS